MSIYRKILSQAWNTTWHSKYLWFFGIFAAIISSSFDDYYLFLDLIGQSSKILAKIKILFLNGIFSIDFYKGIYSLFMSGPMATLLLLIILILLVVLIVFVIWMAVVSKAAIIKNSYLIMSGKENNVKTGLLAGMKNFWPLFSIYILNKIVISFVIFILSFPILLNLFYKQPAGLTFYFVFVFMAFIPLSLIVSFVFKYSMTYVVLEGNNFTESIKKGWRLFVSNLLVSIEAIVILFSINFVIALLLLIISFNLARQIFMLAIDAFSLTQSFIIAYITIALGYTVLIILPIIGGTALTVFETTAWTKLFTEIKNKNVTSKLSRITNNIIK